MGECYWVRVTKPTAPAVLCVGATLTVRSANSHKGGWMTRSPSVIPRQPGLTSGNFQHRCYLASRRNDGFGEGCGAMKAIWVIRPLPSMKQRCRGIHRCSSSTCSSGAVHRAGTACPYRLATGGSTSDPAPAPRESAPATSGMCPGRRGAGWPAGCAGNPSAVRAGTRCGAAGWAAHAGSVAAAQGQQAEKQAHHGSSPFLSRRGE